MQDYAQVMTYKHKYLISSWSLIFVQLTAKITISKPNFNLFYLATNRL